MTCLEEPNSAYITMAPSATYSPATGVTPARSPKAIAEGTSTATTVMATTNSVLSSVGLKPLMRARPGMNRAMPVEVGCGGCIGLLFRSIIDA